MSVNALRINKIIERNLFKKDSVTQQWKEIFSLINDAQLDEKEFVYLMEHPEIWNLDLNKE